MSGQHSDAGSDNDEKNEKPILPQPYTSVF